MSAATTLPVGFLVTMNWASGSDYQSTLLDVLKKAENPALYNDPSLGSDIHTPNDSTLTIGYGYNMSGNKAVVVAEFRSISLFTTRPEAESILTRWAAGQATDTEVRDLNLVISEAQATSLLSYSITRAEAVVRKSGSAGNRGQSRKSGSESLLSHRNERIGGLAPRPMVQ